ncbi:biotin--[acetyl-CoA-carboxylase] ligase [Sphingopyxis alaskensis]|uniref:Biotin--acetyl-CoA-carboxylase ligase n=1 Tax=Sphingopyxis alaskensis (strain DSM 13593 / LMG 18877 / RB2256) TaxID=317655 RepID=Q1GTL3_SPHAL|nr:biotin--[acetyl-CoA-carboxylase] ligase [Sphingopyxis alaskensis]ABF53009.1 Biotin--acetyl-CoA-carboxylase ligase [Sphingopyxis alaskensis RB2256]MCM3420103.1 biotin--[acetyl-CoA-carboxylase] ligase [Sphingopyxis alaskensis]
MAVGGWLSVHPGACGGFGARRIGAVLIPPIERIAQTGSTNADLLARLAGGEHVGEGHWLVADRQTAGRGRLGRSWNDGQGNFMGSTVVHLAVGDPSAATLALVAGVALARTVAALAPDSGAQLKWPNDLLVDGAKCAGILMERIGDSVVIGIGVNLTSAPELPDRPTATLSSNGAAIDRDHFAGALGIAMIDALRTWRQEGVASILRAWLPFAHPVGTPLRVSEQGIDGFFDGLAEDGALRLRREGGETMLIHAGDVELRRPVVEG